MHIQYNLDYLNTLGTLSRLSVRINEIVCISEMRIFALKYTCTSTYLNVNREVSYYQNIHVVSGLTGFVHVVSGINIDPKPHE